MSEDLIRINKLVSQNFPCSRRKAEEFITSGKIRINGEIITDLSARFPASSTIIYNGKQLTQEIKKIYLATYKPVQVLCTMHDPQKRRTIFQLLPEEYKKYRPVPVGRLDFFSEGLLLLTNDGTFHQKIIHPSADKSKVYEVTVKGLIKQEALEDMKRGLILKDGTHYQPVKTRVITQSDDNTIVRMELKQGLNRQIRKMCEKWKLKILKLKRISIGSLNLGNLKIGETRELTKKEINQLLKNSD